MLDRSDFDEDENGTIVANPNFSFQTDICKSVDELLEFGFGLCLL